MDKRNNRRLIIVSIVVFLFFLVVCMGVFFLMIPVNQVIPILFTNEELKRLDNIDRIEIYGTAGNSTAPSPLLKTIDDPDEVNIIVEKVQTYADGWQYPGFNSYYTPQAPIAVYFYRNGETAAIFAFGIGHQNGKPYIDTTYEGKYLSEEEFKLLMSTLDVDEVLTYD